MAELKPLPAISVIVTVRNEAGAITALLDSLLAQTKPPDEIVIVDAGSTDGTAAIAEGYARRGAPVKVVVIPGCNISQGRNAAVRAASYALIAATDAGVRLVPEWLAELTAPFASPDPPDVVSGFFVSDARTIFEKAMGATVLPALADVDPEHFLPSSRSVAFTRVAWECVGGYPEWLDYCEDLIFDLALVEAGFSFAFAPRAVAHFRPRSNLSSFFKQYYRYARGDGKADLWRRRHAVRYGTYIAGPVAFLLCIWYKLLWLPLGLAVGTYLYAPYRRLAPALRGASAGEKLAAALFVPAIRFVGDVAKMLGYPVGVWWRLRHRGGRGWRA
ncbi:MAG: glycosyltransferase [Chloroflexota bacterium]